MHSIDTFSGFGLGLRRAHYQDFLNDDAGAVMGIDFVEVISENYMVEGGNPLLVLEQMRAKMPVIMHGVSMSIGSAHGLDMEYLAQLEMLVNRIDPLWISDHLCWTRTSAHNSHDLLPMPYRYDALDTVCDNVDRAQERLGRAILFENPSSYMTFPDDEMSEWEFIAHMARRTGCYLLLDINNIFVSAHNHGFSAEDYLAGLPMDRVRQIHLAGHTDGDIKIDTHDQPVCGGVWQLYAKACNMLGDVATMIERDDNIPPLPRLVEELNRARAIAGKSQPMVAA